MPCGTISFERRCLNEFPLWNQSPCTLGAFHVRSDGMIEKEGSGMLQVSQILSGNDKAFFTCLKVFEYNDHF